MRTLQHQLVVLFTDRFFAQFWLIAPVLVYFYREHGLTEDKIFLLQSFHNLALVFLEVPTGYLADRLGRKLSLLLSGVLLPVGLFGYLVAESFPQLFVASVFTALSISCRSGADAALLYETLHDHSRQLEYSKFAGIATLLQKTGAASASILGGMLASLKLSYAFLGNAAVACILLPLACLVQEPARKRLRPTVGMVTELRRITGFCFRHPELRFLIVSFALLWGRSIVCSWAYLLYFTEIGLPASVVGLLTAGLFLINGVGSSFANKIEQRLGRRISLMLPFLLCFECLLLAYVKSVWLLPLLFIDGFLTGFTNNLLLTYTAHTADESIRATVASISSMAARLCAVLLSLVAAAVASSTSGLSGVFFLISILLAAGFLFSGFLTHWTFCTATDMTPRPRIAC